MKERKRERERERETYTQKESYELVRLMRAVK